MQIFVADAVHMSHMCCGYQLAAGGCIFIGAGQLCELQFIPNDII